MKLLKAIIGLVVALSLAATAVAIAIYETYRDLDNRTYFDE